MSNGGQANVEGLASNERGERRRAGSKGRHVSKEGEQGKGQGWLESNQAESKDPPAPAGTPVACSTLYYCFGNLWCLHHCTVTVVRTSPLI